MGIGFFRGKRNFISKSVTWLLALSCSLYLFMPVQTVDASESSQVEETGTQRISLLGKYDSADTAVIKSVNTQEQTITFRNHDTGRDYTLNYDNTSYMYSEYGRSLSASLLEPGQVVDIRFLKSGRHLNQLVISSEAWTVENTTNYDLQTEYKNVARIGNSNYEINAQTLLLAEGQQAILQDILPGDTLTVRGIDDEIYSVTVTKGHGYVSLSSNTVGESSLNGAWLEVGNTTIHRVTDHMLVDAPEGDYAVHILGKGADYTKEITVQRDRETVVDTGEIEIASPTSGTVTFQTIPLDATVYVDGEAVLTNVPLTIDYGFHTLTAEADGYESISKYLKVGQSSATIQIRLEESSDVSGNDAETEDDYQDYSSSDASNSASSASTESSSGDVSGNSSSSHQYMNRASTADSAASTSKSTTEEEEDSVSNYKVYVDGPTDAEIYLDGNYIGIAPTYFTKVSGNHTITLKKTGYQTKSYSISIDEALCDKTYSFPSLIPEEDVSGNSTEDNKDTDSASDEEKEDADADDTSTEDTTDQESGKDSTAETGDSSSSSGDSGSSDSGTGGSSSESGSSTGSDSGNTGGNAGSDASTESGSGTADSGESSGTGGNTDGESERNEEATDESGGSSSQSTSEGG